MSSFTHMVDPLPPLIPEREGRGLGDFVGRGGAEVGRVRHGETVGRGAT